MPDPKDTLEIEDQFVAMLPGDGEPEDHIYEKLSSSKGRIQRMMEEAREGHRIAEEEPERGAYHGGPPVEDMGGVTVPADPRNLTGPFVPVPPDEVPPPMEGGLKMRIQTLDEAKAELAAERANHEARRKVRRIAELEAELADLKGE